MKKIFIAVAMAALSTSALALDINGAGALAGTAASGWAGGTSNSASISASGAKLTTASGAFSTSTVSPANCIVDTSTAAALTAGSSQTDGSAYAYNVSTPGANGSADGTFFGGSGALSTDTTIGVGKDNFGIAGAGSLVATGVVGQAAASTNQQSVTVAGAKITTVSYAGAASNETSAGAVGASQTDGSAYFANGTWKTTDGGETWVVDPAGNSGNVGGAGYIGGSAALAASVTITPTNIVGGKYEESPDVKNFNNGWGNGDQDAPGNSLFNNEAENDQD